MTTLGKIHCLNALLLDEMPQSKEHARYFENTLDGQRALLRSLETSAQFIAQRSQNNMEK